MALKLCKISPTVKKLSAFLPSLVSRHGTSGSYCTLLKSSIRVENYLTQHVFREQVRSISFLVTLTAEQLWKGVTSVSNAGKKRGRGRGSGRIVIKDLNKGQVIGVGKSNMVWPGLNTPMIKGKELVQRKQLPPDPEREEKLIQIRNAMQKFRSLKLSPLERGWSGKKLGGRSIGPPDPIGEDTFEGFDTKVLEHKTVATMTRSQGRKRRYSSFVVTGNGNGLAGYALAKAPDGKGVLRKSRNRAGQALMYIERFNNHTIYHNFFAQFGRTKIFAFKKPEGYGLVCHRALKTICEVIGIKDMYAKVEGNTKNYQNLTKAFFHGLVNQKTHQAIADETGLNIIELSREYDFYPNVVASPTHKLSDEEQESKKLDYKEYISEGRVALKKKKWPRFYQRLPGWQIHLKKTVFQRNFEKVKIGILAEKGELKSFLNEKSPDELPLFKGIGKPRYC